jgi:hypothetical protein
MKCPGAASRLEIFLDPDLEHAEPSVGAELPCLPAPP